MSFFSLRWHMRAALFQAIDAAFLTLHWISELAVPFWPPFFVFYCRKLQFLSPKRQNGLTLTGHLTAKIIMDSINTAVK